MKPKKGAAGGHPVDAMVPAYGGTSNCRGKEEESSKGKWVEDVPETGQGKDWQVCTAKALWTWRSTGVRAPVPTEGDPSILLTNAARRPHKPSIRGWTARLVIDLAVRQRAACAAMP